MTCNIHSYVLHIVNLYAAYLYQYTAISFHIDKIFDIIITY